ncbi:MAG: hypothetical protein RIT19_305 [Verrucomicrobiota bacterium]|jgi:hypothetical protein
MPSYRPSEHHDRDTGRFRGGIALAVLVLGLAAGCRSEDGGNGSASRARGGARASGILELHLLTMPVALNLDGAPGPDGVAVKLFANVGNAAKPAPIRRGEVEILLFDGLLNGNSAPLPKPAHSWTFTAKELKGFETQAMVGTGYQITLRWGGFQPKNDRVTVIARHPIGDGRYLYSTPGVIACSP